MVGEAGGGTTKLNPPGGVYIPHSSIVLTAYPDPGWTFLEWIGGSPGADAVFPMTLDHDLNLHPSFGTRVSRSVIGDGSILVEPASELYLFGSTVRLTAVPNSGSAFVGWDAGWGGSENTFRLIVSNANPSVAARFEPLVAGESVLTLIVIGRGSVTQTPPGQRLPTGTVVRLAASPNFEESFLGWDGDATGVANPITIALDGTKTIRAVFSHRPRLSLTESSFTDTGEGFRVRLSGEPGVAYELQGWDGRLAWIALGTVTNRFGEVDFLDTMSRNRPQRLYRAVNIAP